MDDIPAHIKKVYETAKCLHSKEEVNKALDVMADQINLMYADTNPLLLCVMVGGIVLTGSLLPRLYIPLELDYIHATRYRGGIRGHDLEWKVKPSTPLKGRSVLLLDDVLDGGITLSELIKYCKEEGAADIKTAVLVEKLQKRDPGVVARADFTGLETENRYLFGYGMDYKEYLRNAPGIYQIAAEFE